MSHFDNFFNNNTGDAHETDKDVVLDILNKYLKSSTNDDNLLLGVSSFLGDDEIVTFFNDSLKHYIYKKVFNMGSSLYAKKTEYKVNSDIYIVDFKKLFEDRFTHYYENPDDLETLAKDMYKLVQAPIRSKKDKVIKELREHAETHNIETCYLCGVKVDFDTDYSISLLDSVQAKLPKKVRNKVDNHQINVKKAHKKFHNTPNRFILKTKKQKKKLTSATRIPFINEYNKFTSLNEMNQIFVASNFLLNSNKCEIEHNFPASWGGGLSKENIFVACHKCNNKKGNMAFYTDIDYSNTFSTSNDIEKIKKHISAETKISIKIKQKFSCKVSDCKNMLGRKLRFFLINENPKEGLSFFGLSMYCENCIDERFAQIKNIPKEEYIKEYCIHLN